MTEWLTSIGGGFAALIASLVASFSGGGLSLILFPVLLFIAPDPYISLLTVTKIGATIMSITSSRVHFLKAKFDWKFLSYIGFAQIVGTAVGTYLVQYHFDEYIFTQMLGWTVLLTAIYLFFAKKIGLGIDQPREINSYVYFEAGMFCALISILNGIFGGTGIFVTIYFIAILKMSFINAMAYVMPSFAIVNIAQTSYLMLSEWFEWRLALMIILGSVAGGWTGTHLQYLKGNLWVKRAAIVVMFLIGCKTILS